MIRGKQYLYKEKNLCNLVGKKRKELLEDGELEKERGEGWFFQFDDKGNYLYTVYEEPLFKFIESKDGKRKFSWKKRFSKESIEFYLPEKRK